MLKKTLLICVVLVAAAVALTMGSVRGMRDGGLLGSAGTMVVAYDDSAGMRDGGLSAPGDGSTSASDDSSGLSDGGLRGMSDGGLA